MLDDDENKKNLYKGLFQQFQKEQQIWAYPIPMYKGQEREKLSLIVPTKTSYI